MNFVSHIPAVLANPVFATGVDAGMACVNFTSNTVRWWVTSASVGTALAGRRLPAGTAHYDASVGC